MTYLIATNTCLHRKTKGEEKVIMAAFEQHSGIAGQIRSSAVSEQFDLAGFTEARVKELVQNAFSEPLDVPTEMVKFTFVVGGGKLVRSRYSDDMTKWMTNALRELGFTDDRSAAVDFSSQGTYKQQHDTGQNLKYLIVFPHVKCANQKSEEAASDASPSGLNTSSKEYIVSACELSTFQEIVASKTQSWSQRKRLLKVIQDAKATFDALEQKLIQGSLLTPDEQALYDANSGCDQAKVTWLQAEIKAMVDNGNLTKDEKAQLVETLSGNVKSLEAEIAQCAGEGKDKRVEVLTAKRNTVQQRLQAVEAAPPIIHHLKHGNEIQRCVVELQPLYALEEKGRAMALTLADLRTLEAKGDLEQKISQLEAASR